MPSPDNPIAHYQSALAEYCRTGRYEEIPGVRVGRVNHYRRLVYNVVDDMLQAAYPLTFDLVTSEEWHHLVELFLEQHPCRSAQVWSMPWEFFEFVSASDLPIVTAYSHLPELLRIEWAELELFMMEDKTVDYCLTGTVEHDALVVNPEHILHRLQYPVHLKKADEIDVKDKGDYFLVIFRVPESGNVQYLDLSPPLAYLLELLSARPATATAVAQQVFAGVGIPPGQINLAPILSFVKWALEHRLILGFKPA